MLLAASIVWIIRGNLVSSCLLVQSVSWVPNGNALVSMCGPRVVLMY